MFKKVCLLMSLLFVLCFASTAFAWDFGFGFNFGHQETVVASYTPQPVVIKRPAVVYYGYTPIYFVERPVVFVAPVYYHYYTYPHRFETVSYPRHYEAVSYPHRYEAVRHPQYNHRQRRGR
jgi:hypothetical protein